MLDIPWWGYVAYWLACSGIAFGLSFAFFSNDSGDSLPKIRFKEAMRVLSAVLGPIACVLYLAALALMLVAWPFAGIADEIANNRKNKEFAHKAEARRNEEAAEVRPMNYEPYRKPERKGTDWRRIE